MGWALEVQVQGIQQRRVNKGESYRLLYILLIIKVTYGISSSCLFHHRVLITQSQPEGGKSCISPNEFILLSHTSIEGYLVLHP